MSDLTPIPVEQRRAYYDALLAGRAEAQRLGYGLMDDRVFAAFHRALYGPMLAAARADERATALEEAALAIEARKRPGITAMLEGGWNQAIEVAAGVARETAFEAPESHATAREGQGEIGGKRPPSGHATGGVYTGPPIPIGTHSCVGELPRRDDRDDRQEQ